MNYVNLCKFCSNQQVFCVLLQWGSWALCKPNLTYMWQKRPHHNPRVSNSQWCIER